MNKATVLIPVFNTKADHLIEAVFSMIKQTVQVPILIIDDGSTLPETIWALGSLAGYQGVLVKRLNENKGTPSALNYGHSLIDSEYTVIMGSDDISGPDRIRQQLMYLEKNPKVDVLGTQLFGFYSEDPVRKPIFTTQKPAIADRKTVKDKWFTNHGTVIYRNDAVAKVNGYNPKMLRGQDVDLWDRMITAGMTIHNLPNMLYAWRRFKTK